MTTMTATGARQRSRGGDAVLAAGLVMVAVQLVWKFELVRQTYFRQDDFHYIIRGQESGFTWDYLMWVDVGHLLPGGFGISWAMARLGGYNEVLAHTMTIALQAGASLALLRLLRLLFGARPAILVPLGFYLLTPMTIPSLSWWAAVLETLPLQLALPMALSAHILYVRDGRLRHVLAACAWTVFGLLFFVKAAFIPVLMFVVTVGWLGVSWKRLWRAWAPYTAILAAYSVVFFTGLYSSVQINNATQTPELPDLGVGVEFAWILGSRGLVPTMLGGPWAWQPIGDDYAMAATPGPLAWAALGVAAVAVAVTVRIRRRAWLAWLTLLGYFLLADVVPVLLGRIELLGPGVLGYELRYLAATAMVAAIVIGLAVIPMNGEEWPRSRLTWAWVPLAAVFTAGSIWSVTAYADRPLGRTARSYVETARLALSRVPPGSLVLDTHVPPTVAAAAFFHEYARHSKLLGVPDRKPVRWMEPLTGTVRHPLMFDEQGRLLPVAIEGTLVPQGATCVPVGPKEVRFPLPSPQPGGDWTVQISYLNGTETTLSVRLGLGRATAPASKGLGRTFTRIQGQGPELAISAPAGSGACVGEIRIGRPVPAKNAAPVPPQAVGG
ncbi:hypothetical protein SAMN05444920_103721 [Nonomuraea solani]|uniref:4-amino-4-deoxy-L-arabinose transferase n=1 Tax=Nonomuraea solani TaxID=1144553 RepID=A0A1H6BX32_9ACTN|nr:hypothetical protein [Nonomuraea solani]SEG65249.1 hypothetical protein SAMN05444920_103721 [Nonomuraea solani]